MPTDLPVIVGPLPPPAHGVSVFTDILRRELADRQLRCLHLNTSDKRSKSNLGRFDLANVWSGLCAAAALVRLLTRHRPRVLYLPISQNTWAFLRDAVLALIGLGFGVELALHLHGSQLRTWMTASSRPMRALARFILRRTRSFIVLGKAIERDYLDLLPPGSIAVIPNGVPDPLAGSPSAGGTDPDRFTVLYLGSMTEEKGVIDLLHAFGELRRQGVDFQALFAGDFRSVEFRRSFQEHTEHSGVEDRVRLLGSVDPHGRVTLLSAGSVLVCPSRGSEGLPLVILEAMASGLPVVATKRGAVAEVVVDGQNGFVVPPGDPHALAGRLQALATDDDRRVSMGHDARRKYEQHYTAAKLVDKLIPVLYPGRQES